MYRFFAVLVLVLILIAVVGFSRGWFAVSNESAPDSDRVNIGVTVDKSNIRHDANNASETAHELGANARRETQDLIEKIDNRNRDTGHIHLGSKSIELASGAHAAVAVTRDSSDLAREQLGLTPSTGSNLLASGGVFEQGSTSTTITVEAPAGAREGAITISSKSGVQTLNVTIKATPVNTVAPLRTVEVQNGL